MFQYGTTCSALFTYKGSLKNVDKKYVAIISFKEKKLFLFDIEIIIFLITGIYLEHQEKCFIGASIEKCITLFVSFLIKIEI